MYVKCRKNSSGSISVQVVSKFKGKSKLVKTIGCSKDSKQISKFVNEANDYIASLSPQLSLNLKSERDHNIAELFKSITPVVKAVGPELVLGKIFDDIGFGSIPEPLFRHLVLARLVYPVSKLKTTEYLLNHHHQEIEVSRVYRFLDRFHLKYKEEVEEISFSNTQKSLGGKISAVFYDMTTLYFESEDEDDLRKIGFSKDGKFQHPQIMLGLLVSEQGYPISYKIYQGNTFEGNTLIPAIEEAKKRFNINQPVVIADSGLLSKKNISNLSKQNYTFILGARIKNESNSLKKEILAASNNLSDGESTVITRENGLRLIISYSKKRAKKDATNRKKGLKRLEARVKSGKLTKQNLTSRGYNKFLKIDSGVEVSIDDNKVSEDERWDGLKGYVTNSDLSPTAVISNYNHLWSIERAFRISKTDLRIRPIFHRKQNRIEAHICISFVAYALYKELERRINKLNVKISPQKVIELTKTIFQVQITLPDSKEDISKYGKLNNYQKIILEKLA